MYSIDFYLNVNKTTVNFIEKKYEIKLKIQNSLISYAIKNLNKLRLDSEYIKISKHSISYKQKPEVSYKINKLLQAYNLDRSSLETFVSKQQMIYKNYISAYEAKAIVSDVNRAINSVVKLNKKQIKYKLNINNLTFRHLNCSLDLSNNTLSLKYKNNEFVIPFIIKDYDHYGIDSISKNSIHSISIVKKAFNNGYRYYVQFILSGKPPLKHRKGKGRCGIDPGVSTIAAVCNNTCFLEQLVPNSKLYKDKLEDMQRKVSYAYTLKKDKNTASKNYIKKIMKYRTLCRKYSFHMKTLHCMLANKIIENCNQIFYEDMNYVKISSIVLNPNCSKKRKPTLQYIINRNAPSRFLVVLKNKCNFYTINITAIKTPFFKASQYNHVTETYEEKSLDERWNNIDGNKVQRDLYSAFLIKNSKYTLDAPNRDYCINTFADFLKIHNDCINEIKTNTKRKDHPSCFGF